MKVFKFGGASVSTVDRISNVGNILNSFKGEKILIVISAIGKSTNALEQVTEAFYNGDQTLALSLFEKIKQDHLEMQSGLNNNQAHSLSDFFTEIEWLLHDKPVKSFDYYYDQIVCIGELLSS
ncbi:MAG TPA: aspartate kinase, partial [Chitinophagaceae bacterium]